MTNWTNYCLDFYDPIVKQIDIRLLRQCYIYYNPIRFREQSAMGFEISTPFLLNWALSDSDDNY